MKDIAVVSYCRNGLARAVLGMLNPTHDIAMLSYVRRQGVKRVGQRTGRGTP